MLVLGYPFFYLFFIFYLVILKIWHRQIYDFESAKRAGDLFGYPLMIKSRRLAYDGHGNAAAKSEEEISSAVNGLCCKQSSAHWSQDLSIWFMRLK
ncbi:phosphoribosylaminoimidazole carboxylase-like isoform X5 [Camellia sinensis]|uniref:phosphoribosylaminoimidazole carboxylase-like isoform X5 n=1 Tax=Camellia sinensis TaxID=4442 RepID=UPI00103617B0|nr:phosphoribosylaminoimidazole carboxylase-like isoform X5 [Camellia sinensis]